MREAQFECRPRLDVEIVSGGALIHAAVLADRAAIAKAQLHEAVAASLRRDVDHDLPGLVAPAQRDHPLDPVVDEQGQVPIAPQRGGLPQVQTQLHGADRRVARNRDEDLAVAAQHRELEPRLEAQFAQRDCAQKTIGPDLGSDGDRRLGRSGRGRVLLSGDGRREDQRGASRPCGKSRHQVPSLVSASARRSSLRPLVKSSCSRGVIARPPAGAGPKTLRISRAMEADSGRSSMPAVPTN